MRFSAWLATLAFSLVACGGRVDPVSVEFQLMSTEFPGSFPAGTYVFTNASEMAAAWATAPQEYVTPDPRLPPGPIPMPVIDFDKHSIVGVSLGVGIRCFVPQIKTITSTDSNLTVMYTAPPDTGPATLACYHRWPLTAFAKVPAITGKVSFLAVP